MFPIGLRGYARTPRPYYERIEPPPTFEIRFDGNRTVFHPNDVLKGSVRFLGHCRLTLIQGILVTIKCIGELNHTTQSSDQFFQRTYFAKQRYVYGNGKSSIATPKRLSVFPFEFKLPADSDFPQTFIGLYGSVICTIEVSLKSKLDDNVCLSDIQGLSLRINLNTALDLNKLKRAHELRESVEKRITHTGLFKVFSLVKHEAMRINFMVSQGAYAPDEILSFSVEIANETKLSISSTRVELTQEATYTETKSTFLAKTTSKPICSVNGPLLNSNNFQKWEGVLEVPHVPCTTVGDAVGCIRIAYKLKLIVETEDECSDVKAGIPIYIGSVPLTPLDGESNDPTSSAELRNAKYKRGSIASLLSFGNSRRPSTSSSIHRLPDYFTAAQDVQHYPDPEEIPPPTYDEAIAEIE